MAKTAAEISDDWSEIDDDDNFSIVSLPTDDGQSEPVATPSPADAAPVEPSRTITLPIRGPRPEDAGPPPCYDDVPAADAKDTLPATETAASTWSASSSDRSVNEILDVDLDPTFLQKVASSLIKLIGEVLGTINFEGNFDQPQGAYGIRAQCYALRDHLKSLEPIMLGYSKHWDPDEANSVTLPLDPGLYEWMSNLRIELLGLQDILQRHMANNLGVGAPDKRTTASRLDKYNDSLVEFATEIENFLPIIQEDFNEFHAANLPAEVTDSAASGAHHETLFGPGRDAAVARLRRELYDLKDWVSTCRSEVRMYRQRQALAAEPQDLLDLSDSYQVIKSTLDSILTSNPSEWLDSSTAGGLTWPEFCRLNPDTVRSLTLQLREVGEKLTSHRNEVNAVRYTLLEDRALEFGADDLATLQSVRDILSDLFRIRTPRAGRPDREATGHKSIPCVD